MLLTPRPTGCADDEALKRAARPNVARAERATLARQLLLERAGIGVVPAIERVAALQAQWAPSPYIALWSRLESFRREKLWSAIERREVIRARLMRGTLHLVSARDFYAYAVATQDLQRGAWNRYQVGRGVDPKKVAALAIAFARHPRPKEEVLEHIQEHIGGKLGGPFNWLVWRFVSAHADLVTAPPGGHWEYGGTDAPYVAARHWIARGERPSEEDALEILVRRCLAAFGPARLADIAKFAGQVPPRVRPTLERIAPKLRTFSDNEGRLLYDLPRAPRPEGDVGAPVRFLPRYDELLISYEHRDRLIAQAHRRAVYTKNAIVEAVVMVDGFAAGTWSIVRAKNEAVLGVAPFARLVPSDRLAVEAEGQGLLCFLAPDAKTVGVRFL